MTPIIAPDSNLLSCSEDGLLANLLAGSCVFITETSPGVLTVDAEVSGDAGQALECTASGLYVPGMAADTSSGTVVGGGPLALTDADGGVVGPTLTVTVSNPSSLAVADVLGMFLASSEQVEMIEDQEWSIYLQTSINGSAFANVGLNRYSTLNLAADTYAFANGANMVGFTGTIPAGGSISLAMRKFYVGDFSGCAACSIGTIVDTGSLEIRALKVAV